ncbi:protein of unknown function (plasmid) [Shinella sp. WSC3-e]|nr:protein of unknown function [Shinella sp. WSC3-e]
MQLSGTVKDNVLVGENGWLFLWGGGHRQFDYLRGICTPDQATTQNFADNIASRRAICAARNLPYLHVVYPSKPIVMTDLLPSNLQNGVRSLFDYHFKPRLDSATQASVLYPKENLIAARLRSPVFSEHDTHMTNFGDKSWLGKSAQRG